MSSKMFLGMLLGATALAPAFAQDAAPPPGPEGSAQQVQRGYANPPMPNQEAINAGGRAGTAALNNDVAVTTGVREAVNIANIQRSAEDQAIYEADREAYWGQLAKHDRAVDRRNERYIRQQTAYADAMWAWRLQVAACKKGKTKICNAPAPTVADFY